jgi:DNA-binding IclR family transcriptional regulator
MTLGSCSLAAPVRDPDGEVAGALGVVVSTRRAAELPRLVAPLQATVARIEESLRDDAGRVAAS